MMGMNRIKSFASGVAPLSKSLGRGLVGVAYPYISKGLTMVPRDVERKIYDHIWGKPAKNAHDYAEDVLMHYEFEHYDPKEIKNVVKQAPSVPNGLKGAVAGLLLNANTREKLRGNLELKYPPRDYAKHVLMRYAFPRYDLKTVEYVVRRAPFVPNGFIGVVVSLLLNANTRKNLRENIRDENINRLKTSPELVKGSLEKQSTPKKTRNRMARFAARNINRARFDEERKTNFERNQNQRGQLKNKMTGELRQAKDAWLVHKNEHKEYLKANPRQNGPSKINFKKRLDKITGDRNVANLLAQARRQYEMVSWNAQRKKFEAKKIDPNKYKREMDMPTYMNVAEKIRLAQMRLRRNPRMLQRWGFATNDRNARMRRYLRLREMHPLGTRERSNLEDAFNVASYVYKSRNVGDIARTLGNQLF